jgi:hypothetical protein
VTGSDEDDPVAEFVRAYRAQVAGGAAEQDALHRQVEEARTWTWAAVGALNRRDDVRALTALGRVLREPGSTMVAVEVLTGILLIGVPPGAARFPIELPGEQHLPEALRLASDLLTGVARSDGGLVTAGLRALAGDDGMAVLTVLARAAALRIELFVGLDGDTGDAYYWMARGSAIG